MNLLEKIAREGSLKARPPIPDMKAGDTVRVHNRVKEGDKERIQIFEGIVIRKKGHACEATFTVRKVSYGVGVERIFPFHAPSVAKVEIVSRGQVRRAKLYYLRDLQGKKARILGLDASSDEQAVAAPGADIPA